MLERMQAKAGLVTAAMLVPILKVTGYRFSKRFRHGDTLWHRVVYSAVDTVQANLWAGMELQTEKLRKF